MTFYKAFLRQNTCVKKKTEQLQRSKNRFFIMQKTPACLKKFHPTKTHDGAVSQLCKKQ